MAIFIMQMFVQQRQELGPHSKPLALHRSAALMPTPNVQQVQIPVSAKLDSLSKLEPAVSVFDRAKRLRQNTLNPVFIDML